jgi:hypothetical protein
LCIAIFIKVCRHRRMKNLDALFDDKRILCLCIACWTTCVTIIFVCIMIDDHSPFLSFGPNDRTVLFGVKVDSWTKWGCIAMYTFVATCIADFTSDSVGPFVTNTIQDHKNLYIPYSKSTCVMIVQVFAVYVIIMNTIGLFVALSQIDFMMIRMSADLMVNYYTCHRFMRFKTVNEELYSQYIKSHCTDAVHYSAEVDGGDGSSYCSTAATTPPRAATPQHPARSASPVGIRRAASASARTPSSDNFEGMPRQSLVPVSHETLQLYGSSEGAKDRVVAYRQHQETNNQNVFVVHSPRDCEHETSKLVTNHNS